MTAPEPVAPVEDSAIPAAVPHTGSLSRRMMIIAAGWITFLLLVGGLALDRTLAGQVTRNFDDQLNYMLTAMVASVEVGPDGEVFFTRPPGDQRFLEPNSGLYWQISGKGHEDYSSRSLWDRSLKRESQQFLARPRFYDSDQFAGQELRVVERSDGAARQQDRMVVRRRCQPHRS